MAEPAARRLIRADAFIGRPMGGNPCAVIFHAPEFGASWPPKRGAPRVGLASGDILGVPRTVSTGTACLIVRLPDHDVLRRARLDLDRGAAIRGEADFFEPFLCATRGFMAEGDSACG